MAEFFSVLSLCNTGNPSGPCGGGAVVDWSLCRLEAPCGSKPIRGCGCCVRSGEDSREVSWFSWPKRFSCSRSCLVVVVVVVSVSWFVLGGCPNLQFGRLGQAAPYRQSFVAGGLRRPGPGRRRRPWCNDEAAEGGGSGGCCSYADDSVNVMVWAIYALENRGLWFECVWDIQHHNNNDNNKHEF